MAQDKSVMEAIESWLYAVGKEPLSKMSTGEIAKALAEEVSDFEEGRIKQLEAALLPFSEACLDTDLHLETDDHEIWEHPAGRGIHTIHLRTAYELMKSCRKPAEDKRVSYYIWPDGSYALAEDYDQIEDCQRDKSDDFAALKFLDDAAVDAWVEANL